MNLNNWLLLLGHFGNLFLPNESVIIYLAWIIGLTTKIYKREGNIPMIYLEYIEQFEEYINNSWLILKERIYTIYFNKLCSNVGSIINENKPLLRNYPELRNKRRALKTKSF